MYVKEMIWVCSEDSVWSVVQMCKDMRSQDVHIISSLSTQLGGLCVWPRVVKMFTSLNPEPSVRYEF